MPPTQRALDYMNPRLPAPRIKAAVRATGVPVASRIALAVAGELVGKTPHYLSIYHRESPFFFPREKFGRTAQVADLFARESRRVNVTSVNIKGKVTDTRTAASVQAPVHHDGDITAFSRDSSSLARLFPYTDFIEGFARGRATVGLSPIHMRGVVATNNIPKGGVVLCTKKMDFVDPIGAMLLGYSHRSLPALWRFYSCFGGAAFALPLTPSPIHFLNHSCDANLRCGFFFPKKLQPSAPLPPSMFVRDPTEWMKTAARYGDAGADAEGVEPPLLRSLSMEEVAAMNEQVIKSASSSSASASIPIDTSVEHPDSAVDVDWNCFVAQRDISAGEELTIDYARHIAPSFAGEFTKLSVSVTSPCNCNSKHCSGDMYRSVPSHLDVVSSHEQRRIAAAPYFSGVDARMLKMGDNSGVVADAELPPAENAAEEEERESIRHALELESLRKSRRDPHDDDLVRASFLMNRQELINKMHKSLPRSLLWKSELIINANATCKYLTSVLAKGGDVRMPGDGITGSAVSPNEFY